MFPGALPNAHPGELGLKALPRAGLRVLLIPLLQLVPLPLLSLPICPPQQAELLLRAGISSLSHGMRPPAPGCFKKKYIPCPAH